MRRSFLILALAAACAGSHVAPSVALNFFTEISALYQLPNSDVASDILKRLAADVEPLLIVHPEWRPVALLAEIYPPQRLGPRGGPLPANIEAVHGHLGGYTSAGREIGLTLRADDRPDTFIVYAQLLDTFLHELAHQSFKNHAGDFAALWETLLAEYAYFKSQNFLGEPSSRGASTRTKSWGIDSVSYGIGVKTSGAWSVNSQTGQEHFMGAIYLASSLEDGKRRALHFAVLEAWAEARAKKGL